MPITFTDEDFTDAPAVEKLTFTDEDFAPQPVKLDLSKPPPFNAMVDAQMRAAAQGRLPYNPLSGGYTGGNMATAPTEDISLSQEYARKPWMIATAPFEIGAAAIEQAVHAPIAWAHEHLRTVGDEPLDNRRDADAKRTEREVENRRRWEQGLPPLPPEPVPQTKYVTPASVGITPDTPMIEPPRPDQHGVGPALWRAASSMTTPTSVATLPFFEARLPRLAFAGATFASVPESIQDLANAKTDAERREALANITLKTAMGSLLARSSLKGGGDASSIKEAAEVHGDVRPQPGEGAREVPLEEGGKGVQPRPEAVAEKAQVSLSPEEQGYIDAERKGMSEEVEYATPATGDEPFAGQIATINRKKGSIVINPQEFSAWLKGIPAERRAQAVRSLLDEERIHLKVDDTAAGDYWGTLTAAEKAINRRRYTGKWSDTGELSDTDMGHEALRFRLQQLSRMMPREIADAVGRERWTFQAITAAESAIRKARETLGTKASGTQNAILDRMMDNLNVAKIVATGGNPSAIARKPADQYEKYPDPTGRITSLSGMDPTSFSAAVSGGEGGLTGDAWRLGLSVSSPEEAAMLKKAMEETTPKIDAAKAKKDFNAWGQEAMRKQYFREAYEAATGTGSAAHHFREDVTYRPPAPLESTPAAIRRQAEEPPKEPEPEDVSEVTALDPQSGRPLTATESLAQRLEGNWNPGARRRNRGPEDHPELFLPPKGKGTLSKPETEPAGEGYRKAVEASYKPITPAAVAGEIQSHLSQSPRPNFDEFVDKVKTRYGNVQPEQLREAWRDWVWKHLMAAPGAELGRLYRTLGLAAAERSGRARVAEPGRFIAERPVPDPIPERPREGQQELLPGTIDRGPMTETQKVIEQRDKSAQAYRAKVMGAIGLKLIQESETGRKAWGRKDVKPEEIGFWRASAEPAWNTITAEDIANPEALGRMLTADAREEASTRIVRTGTETAEPISVKRKAPPVSVTKRLTAMLNRRTGEVDLVDTYRDGRRGAVMFDPQAPGRTHSTLSSMLSRYRPLQSILLDEPVQNFHKRFSSVREFEEQFGQEARNRAAEHTDRESELAPEAGVLEGAPDAPSALAPGQRLTDAEAGSLFDAVNDEVGKVEGPEDVGRLVEGLHERMTSGKTDPGDWAAIAALEKVYNGIRRKFPEQTPDQAIEQTYEELAQFLQDHAEDRKGFQAELVGKYSPEVSRPVGSAPPPAAKPVESGARELSTMRDVPPTVDPNVKLPPGPGPEPELPTPQPPEMLSPKDQAHVARMAEEHNPGAVRRAKSNAQDEFTGVKGMLKAWNERRRTTRDIVAGRDAVDTTANNYARAAGDAVRVQTKAPSLSQSLFSRESEGAKVRAAAKALIAAGRDKSKLDNFLQMLATAKVKAENYRDNAKLNPDARRVGRKWVDAVDRLTQEVQFAKDNWRNPELWRVAKVAQKELRDELEFESQNGIDLKPVDNYVPGRYDAEFFNDNAVMFGEQRVLGRQYWKPKAFQNYYSAIMAGPYIPKSYDLADLVEHRVRQGRKQVNKQMWLDSLKEVQDPMSKKPIVVNPIVKEGRQVPPSPQHELFSLGPGKDTVAVRRGYKDLLDVLTMQGGISKSPVGKVALAANGLLKHGVILILDTFHPGRLGQYGVALMGKEAGFRGGWSALDYREADLPKAIENGWVSKESAAWAEKPLGVTMPDGSKRWYSRRQILDMMQRQGLNVGRLQDALYSDAVRNIPIVGSLNRWTFDVMTRGLMAESAVRSFEKLNAKYPNADARQLMKDVVRDTNFYYGSIGRQGLIRNPTFREAAQILMLAPQWVEGLVQKEVRTAYRLGTAPASALKGTPMLGALGSGMAKGLVGYLALTQLLNFITRGKSTFQNPEEDHKLDAWIPTGENTGFWLSPMSVFAEVTHDIIRLGESKPTVYDAIRQVGANKLSPLGRMAWIFASRENQQGQRITSTGGMALEMAKQLAPAPISLGTPARALGHAVAPNLVSPPPPGALQQRLLGSAGIKVQAGQSAVQQVQRFADEFMQKNGLKPETGFVLQPTDEASYSKLRSAIRNGDPKQAKSMMEALRKTHSDEQILKSMHLWSKRPMTGSNKGEMLLLEEMSDEQFKTYAKAIEEKQKIWNDFIEFYMKN